MNAVQKSPGPPSLTTSRYIKEEPSALSSSSSSSVEAPLDFYAEIPSYELSLDEFEEFALARLKVLRKIEELRAQNITGAEFRTNLESTLKENLTTQNLTASKSFGTIAKPSAKEQSKLNQKIDTASHFILRAAYCRTEDLRRWFLTQECALFRFRLDKILTSSSAFRAFLVEADLHFDRVSDLEKERLRDFLLSIPNSNVSPGELSVSVFYQVPFVQALDLVAKRLCYVHDGMAYVPQSRMVSIIVAKYRMALSKSLVRAALSFGEVTEENERIAPLLKSMNSQYLGRDYGKEDTPLENDELTANTVDSYAKQSMPLCMSQLHAGMKRDSKLKHQGRLQYGLFLKGGGMSTEEHLAFFQRVFTKIMTTEQFNKNYSYNIRHMHGQEGKRASYSPYSCMKIILGNPPQGGESHGCPFRHYDDSSLSSLLTKLNVGSASDRSAILAQKKARNYQLACAKHFEVMHPGAASVEGLSMNGVGNHPNAWFAASVGYHKAKNINWGEEKDMVIDEA